MRSAVFLALLPPVYSWFCIPIQEKELRAGVLWKTQNCSKGEDGVDDPLLVVNSVHVDLSRDDIRVVPGVASKEEQVQSLPEMGDANEKYIAGINGGYFWRVDIDGFWRDNVCRGKLRKEAEQDANPLIPNFGIGDGLIKIDGETLSSNCNCSGYSRPAVMSLDGPAGSGIEVLQRGEQGTRSARNAIGAGPNLVSFDSETGESYVDVPSDDDNINKLVFEATTAAGLTFEDAAAVDAQTLVMVTTDGSDSCLPHETYCGTFSWDLAALMKDIFSTRVAMSMDQGGSTTMWVRGENPSRNGVVSRSDNKEPEESEGARRIANGLFVEVLV